MLFSEQGGCRSVVKLEKLVLHVSKCEYNMSGEVVCDKGCNIRMARREYQVENCFSHLAKEVTKLRQELCEQKIVFERTVKNLADQLYFFVSEPPEWQHIQNIDTNGNELKVAIQNNSTVDYKFAILHPSARRSGYRQSAFGRSDFAQRAQSAEVFPEFDQSAEVFPEFNQSAFVQSTHALEPTRSHFRILISSVHAEFQIGLTRKGYFRRMSHLRVTEQAKTRLDDITNNYLDHLECKNGDVIECGIEFPNNFSNDGNQSVQVYLIENQKLISNAAYVIPKGGFYPTIILKDQSVVRYCQKKD